MKPIIKIFTESLLNWFAKHGRQNLPWQHPYDPYRVWISEIMLQQTQVKTVIPFFLNFMIRFPDVHALATAPLDDVLAAWSGLGYYSRARNLHQTAQKIALTYAGSFPKDLSKLQDLPGIGRSTAAAIASLAFELPTAILDGNVKRVLSRFFKVSGIGTPFEKQLWELANACMPAIHCRAYTQAIMDLGALCCTPHHPQCKLCPLQADCQAFNANVVGEYPPKKPKKIRPIRQEKFLVLYDSEHRIYLEQRPPSGIWGGLWCLPSISHDRDITAHLNSLGTVIVDEVRPIMTIKHALTHFQFNISAYAINTIPNPRLPGTWYRYAEIDSLGLAKPVKDIIERGNAVLPILI